MSAVDQLDARVRRVPREGLRTGGGEDLVVPAPDREQRYAGLAEPGVHRRVELPVGGVVAEERELNVVLAGAGEEREVVLPGVGIHDRRVRHAVRVLPLHGLAAEGRAEGIARGVGALGGVGPDRIPERRHEALLVGVAVLRDDARDRGRVGERQAPADGCAVVLHVDRVALDPDRGEEAAGHVGERGERVVELVDGRRGRPAEPDEVRCDDAEAARERRDQVPEHVRARRVPVEQQEHGRVGGPGLAPEDVEAVEGDGAVADGDHG